LPVIPIKIYPRAVARAALGEADVIHDLVKRPAVTHVTHANVTHDPELPMDLGGWTLCHDSRGIYKAVKRINGRLKSVYISRNPSRAAEKITAWAERQGAEMT